MSLQRFRPVLVPLSVAATILEVEPESVREMVESGRLRWVWNVASTASRAELRFWLAELLGRGLAGAPGSQVIERVVGYPFEKRLRCRTVCNLLYIARPHLQRLTGELPISLEGGLCWISRADVVRFLERRLWQ